MSIKEFCTLALEGLKDNTPPREFGHVLATAQSKAKVRDLGVGLMINEAYRGSFQNVEGMRMAVESLGGLVASTQTLPVPAEDLAKPVEVMGAFTPQPSPGDEPNSVESAVPKLSKEEKKLRRLDAEV